MFWLRYMCRSLMRGGRRTVFALVCVAVGVAGVVALQTASLTVQYALTSNVRAANGGDISLTTDASQLSTSDLKVFARLQRQGQISRWSAVSTIRGTTVGTQRTLVPFDIQLVQSPPYPVGGEPTFVSPSDGKVAALLHHPTDALISAVLAQELGVGVGGRLFVDGLGGRGLSVTVRGVVSETSFEHSAIMTLQRADAAALTDRSLTYSAVYLNMGSASPARVATLLRNRFPLANVSTVADALQSAQLQVHDFHQFLLLVALFALLIAGVGILNAMQSMLVWRRLEIAMLKAMGFGRISLYTLFGGEALMLGLVGGVVGTVLGVGASREITDALARALAISVTYRVDASTLVGGVALGAGATLIFSILPIVRATAIRPLEILRESQSVIVGDWVRSLGLVAVVLLLFGALAAAIVGDSLVAAEFVGGAAAGCIVMTGLYSVVVAWLGRLGRPASRPAGLLVGLALLIATLVVARRVPALAAIVALVTALWAATVLLPQRGLLPLLIAVRSLSRRRARTSMTLVAFLSGVLAMTVTLTVSLSLQGQINDVLAATGKTNLVVVANPGNERAVLSRSRSLPGLQSESVTALASTRPIAVNGTPIGQILGPAPSVAQDDGNDTARLLGSISGYQLRAGDLPPGLRIVDGRPLGRADAGTNHVLLRAFLQDSPPGLRLGDRITLRSSTSSRSRVVVVVGFYSRPRAARGFGSFFVAPVIGDTGAARAIGGPDVQSIVGYVIQKGQLTHDAAVLQREVPGALVVDVGDLTAVVETILGELLNLLAVITALVLGAGIAVVANGVALAMFERRRELALYKAIGFGPGSVLRFVLVENGLAGTLAGAGSVLGAAIALGVLSRLALQQAIGFDPFLAVLVLAIAACLAVLTAYLAARTPIRIRPIEALRNE